MSNMDEHISEQDFQLFFQEKLTESQVATLEAHIQLCHDCQLQLVGLESAQRKTEQQELSLPEGESKGAHLRYLPANEDRLSAAVNKQRADNPSSAKSMRRHSYQQFAALAAALALFILVPVMWLQNQDAAPAVQASFQIEGQAANVRGGLSKTKPASQANTQGIKQGQSARLALKSDEDSWAYVFQSSPTGFDFVQGAPKEGLALRAGERQLIPPANKAPWRPSGEAGLIEFTIVTTTSTLSDPQLKRILNLSGGLGALQEQFPDQVQQVRLYLEN